MQNPKKTELLKQLACIDIGIQECIARANICCSSAISGEAGRRNIVRGDDYVFTVEEKTDQAISTAWDHIRSIERFKTAKCEVLDQLAEFEE